MKEKGMQQMVGRLMANVLGCLILFATVSACSTPQPRSIEISAKPVDRPELVLPSPDRIQSRPIDWIIVTPDNAEAVFERIRATGRPVTFFALTENGYEALALNLNDLRTFIQQLQTIIQAYENYYAQSTEALEEANRRMREQAEAANALPEEPKGGILGIFN
jgi:ABC-type transporter Mla subunit MlaD